MLHSVSQQIWKTQSGHGTEKVSFHSNPKGNAKECSNYRTIALISHSSKVTLKILQARLQQYMNRELPDVQAGWDGWMASPTLWMWVWVNSGSWWWTGVLHSWGHKDSDTTEWLNWNWKRVLCLWNSPGKNTGDGSHFLLQGLFLTQGSNPGLLPCMHTLLPAPTREAHIKV